MFLPWSNLHPARPYVNVRSWIGRRCAAEFPDADVRKRYWGALRLGQPLRCSANALVARTRKPARPASGDDATKLAGPTPPNSPGQSVGLAATLGCMCRNITGLRGLEPAATPEEIQAAALQYVRKVGGLSSVSAATRSAVEVAVAEIAATTARLLADLPERAVPPKSLPPLRRPEVRARMQARG